jgi:tartrate-resistant acid phosphatase type 5
VSRRLAALCAAAAAVACAVAAPAMAVRFAVKGDWGSGTANQAAVTTRMCATWDRARFPFVLTTGDNFYPAGRATPATFDRPERCLLDRGVRYRAVWGNHDAPGPSTRDVLSSPARWYTFITGPARLVVLDGNQPENPAQLRFLRRVLAAERVRPVIVAYHQPTRTAGLHEPQTSQQRVWEPLFERYKVRLVLQGHNHLYERIRFHGITYVTTGGGGANLYPCVRPAAGLVMCKPVFHFLMVEVTSTHIGVRAIDTGGGIVDRFRIDLTPPPPAG